MTENEIKECIAATAGLSPQDLLAWAAGKFAGQVAFASSLGAEDQVLTDMIARGSLPIAIFTIDTGRLPRETHDLIDATRKRYGIEIVVLFPGREQVEELVRQRGVNLFYESIENRKACCHVRKVLPLRRRLAGLQAWITGLRREQAVTRNDVAAVQWDGAHGRVKINPLADWSEAQVWQYLRHHDVPYNALHDRGYPSIGCEPCTRAVAPGADIRSGRWWWEQPQHKECGLHVVDGRLGRAEEPRQ